MNLREILCQLLGCKADCTTEEQALRACLTQNEQLDITIRDLKAEIEQLKLLVPHPAPPKIDNIAQRDSAFIQQVINGFNLDLVWLQLDITYYLTTQAGFLNIVAWDWVDSYEYRKDRFDCENFAFLFKARTDLYFGLNQVAVVLDYQSGHAYNLVIYPDGNAQVLEPQSDALYIWTKRPQTFYDMRGAIVLI